MENIQNLLDELNALDVSEDVKSQVNSLVGQIRVLKLRQERGMVVPAMSYHMIFEGNYGDAMTAVAGVVGRIYRELGILSKGHLVEVGREDLVSEYIGHTAIKTKEVVDTAIGGILLIKDAYSLDEGDSILRAFGNEAMDVIARAIEEHSDDLVVVMSGDKAKMDAFVDANPGLCLGFKTTVGFEA